MNIKRAIVFGVLLWILIFVVYSILMFTPWFKDSPLRINVGLWVSQIIFVLLACKWYFKSDSPTIKKGFLVGLVALIVGTILDMIITVPLSTKSYLVYYGSWMLYVGYLWVLILTTYAGYEFDATYTKSEKSLE